MRNGRTLAIWFGIIYFFLVAALQWNDPDTGVWMSLYGAAGGLCLANLRWVRPGNWMNRVWGRVSLLSGLFLLLTVVSRWEQEPEVVREAFGLILMGAYFLGLNRCRNVTAGKVAVG